MINKLGNSTGNKTYSSSPKGADLRAPYFSFKNRFLGYFWGYVLLKMPCRVFCKAFQRRDGRDSAPCGRAISFLPEGSLQPIAAHDLAVVRALSFMALRELAHDGHKQNRPALLRWAAMVAERTTLER